MERRQGWTQGDLSGVHTIIHVKQDGSLDQDASSRGGEEGAENTQKF